MVKIQNGTPTIDQKGLYQIYRRIGNSFRLQDRFDTSVLVHHTYLNETTQFMLQPVEITSDIMFDSPVQVNTINNISGLITKINPDQHIYKITSQITKDIEEHMQNYLHSLRFTFDPQESQGSYKAITDLTSEDVSSENFYLATHTPCLNGVVQVKPNKKVFLPVCLISKLNQQLFQPSKRLVIEGHQGTQENLWLETVLDADNLKLYAAIFGEKTQQIYGIYHISDNITSVYGMDYDGKYIYFLVQTDEISVNVNDEHNASMWLLRYDPITKELTKFEVQYIPVDPYGIKLIGRILLVAESHGVVALEFIDSTVSIGTSYTTFYAPFDYIMTPQTLEDEPIKMFFQYDPSGLMSPVDQTSMSYTLTNINWEERTVNLTSIDKLCYLVSFERQDNETAGELFARQHTFITKGVSEAWKFQFIYPFAVKQGFVLSLNNLPAEYDVLSANDVTVKLAPVEDITQWYDSTDTFKQHIQTITEIEGNLEREQTEQPDQTVYGAVKTVDNLKPICPKLYELVFEANDAPLYFQAKYYCDEGLTQELSQELKAFFGNTAQTWADLNTSNTFTDILGNTKTGTEWIGILQPNGAGWYISKLNQDIVVDTYELIQYTDGNFVSDDIILRFNQFADPIKQVGTYTVFVAPTQQGLDYDFNISIVK